MKYIDSSHSYVSEKGEEYVSVTKLIKTLEPYKDWTKIAEKYAKKHKKTVEEVQALWKEEGRKAVEKGTRYHSEMEESFVKMGKVELDGNIYDVIHTPIEDDVKLAIPLTLGDSVYPELIVYSHRYKVAGQADLVEIYGGTMHITDYKTSKEIKMESFQNWKKEYEMLKAPVNHLMNCNFNTYSLQINIYMYLLKTHNPDLHIGKMNIAHVQENTEVFAEEPYKITLYKIPDLQREAKAVLDYHANKNL